VRQARIPSIAAINPEIDPELEAIVRKALARDPNDRYAEAADLGDALAQFLFSHRMKVTARDISVLVKDVQTESLRRRSLVPHDSLIDALIKDEMGKVTSLVDEDSPAGGAESGGALDPSALVDTSNWAADFDIAQPPTAPKEPVTPPPAARNIRGSGRQSIPPEEPRRREPDPDSLQQMLEPDRTGVHEVRESKLVMIAVVILVLLAAAVGTGLVLFKDRIFG
jgi:hypothetical protein